MSDGEPIRSGKQAPTSIVAAAGIDWRYVTGLEIWSLRRACTRQISAPGGLDIRWMTAVGVRYAVAVAFDDNTWVWTDLVAELDAAVLAVQRFAAEHDKPIGRSPHGDKVLRARGY